VKGKARDARVVVPDASVILKWVDRISGEKDRERADALLDAWLDGRLEIVVPRLWAFVVANVLGRVDPSGAGPIMEGLLGYRFEEEDTTSELCRTAFADEDFGSRFTMPLITPWRFSGMGCSLRQTKRTSARPRRAVGSPCSGIRPGLK
jgi:hypothetical protein